MGKRRRGSGHSRRKRSVSNTRSRAEGWTTTKPGDKRNKETKTPPVSKAAKASTDGPAPRAARRAVVQSAAGGGGGGADLSASTVSLEYPSPNEQQHRESIATCFIKTFDGPPEEEWEKRRVGTITLIQKQMAGGKNGWIPQRTTIRNVLHGVQAAALRGERYTAERAAGSGGHNKLIQMNDVESQIIADCMEDGIGIRMTTEHVNQH